MAPPQVAAVDVDLQDGGLGRVELAPREVGAQQQQRVALLQGAVARLDAEDAGHAHVEGVVVLHEVLGARGVRDRRLEALPQREQHLVSAFAAVAGIDRDLPPLAEQRRQLRQLRIVGPQHRPGAMHGVRQAILHLGLRDVARQDDHRHALARQRGLCSERGEPLCLLRRVHLLAEDGAVRVERLEVDLLGELHAELGRDDLAGDQHHGRAIAVGLEHAVDEMQAAGPARAGAGRELARQVGLGARGECRRFLMPHMDPLDVAAVNGVGDMVERVSDDAVAMLDARVLKGFDDEFGDFALSHGEGPGIRCIRPIPDSRSLWPRCSEAVGRRRLHR